MMTCGNCSEEAEEKKEMMKPTSDKNEDSNKENFCHPVQEHQEKEEQKADL